MGRLGKVWLVNSRRFKVEPIAVLNQIIQISLQRRHLTFSVSFYLIVNGFELGKKF